MDYSGSPSDAELRLRRKLRDDLCLKPSDFESPVEYNDFLEDVENIVFYLSNRVDIELAKKKKEFYRTKYMRQISKNRSEKSVESRAVPQTAKQEMEEKAPESNVRRFPFDRPLPQRLRTSSVKGNLSRKELMLRRKIAGGYREYVTEMRQKFDALQSIHVVLESLEQTKL